MTPSFKRLPPQKNGNGGRMNTPQMVWLGGGVRLARNLRGAVYPWKADPKERRAVLAQVVKAIQASPVALQWRKSPQEDWGLANEELFPQDRLQMTSVAEGNKAEAKENLAGRALYLDIEDGLAVGVNMMDHLRIWVQCPVRLPEHPLEAASVFAHKIAEELGQTLDYAFDPKLGHLTALSVERGTGMEATALLHLPGLVLTKNATRVARGLRMRGYDLMQAFHPKATRVGQPQLTSRIHPPGHLFYLMNRRYDGQGQTVTRILQSMETEIQLLETYEMDARATLWETRRRELTDRVARAWAVLREAYLLPYQETLDRLSMLQLGTQMGILPIADPGILQNMFLAIQPEHLKKHFGSRDIRMHLRAARATVVQEILDLYHPLRKKPLKRKKK